MGAKRTKAQKKKLATKKKLRIQNIKRVEGILNNLTGHLTEQRFFDAFESAKLPKWLHKISKASFHFDQMGVDAIASTDSGKFYIQIKSSEHGAIKFKAKERLLDISVVVALRNDTPEFIRYQTINALSDARDKVREANKLLASESGKP